MSHNERGTRTREIESCASEATVDLECYNDEILIPEELNDDDLKSSVEHLEKNTNVLRLENEMMIRYLVRNAQYDEAPLREQLDRLGERMLELEQIRKTRSLYSSEGKLQRTTPGRLEKFAESASMTSDENSMTQEVQKTSVKGEKEKNDKNLKKDSQTDLAASGEILGAVENGADVPGKKDSKGRESVAKDSNEEADKSTAKKSQGQEEKVASGDVVSDVAVSAVPSTVGSTSEAKKAASSQLISISSSSSSSTLISTPSGFSAFEKRGPRLNVTGKVEMVARELREGHRELDAFEAVFARKKLRLGQRLEAAAATVDELQEEREAFEREVVVGGVHPVTGRISAECFLRHLSKWSRANALLSDKLRLRSATLRVNIRKAKVQLEEKRELGETLAPVDFEQQRIDNERFLHTLEQKSLQVLELKRLAGDCALQLSVHRKALLADRDIEDTLRNAVEQRRKQCERMEQEARHVGAQNERLRSRLESLRTLTNNFAAPPVLDYARLCAKVAEQEHEIRMWRRRVNLQQTALQVSSNKLRTSRNCLRPNSRGGRFRSGHTPCDDVDDVNSAAFQNFWFGDVTSSRALSREGNKAGARSAAEDDTEEDDAWANIAHSFTTEKSPLRTRTTLPACTSPSPEIKERGKVQPVPRNMGVAQKK